MTAPAKNTDHLVGRFFVGLFALAAAMTVTGIAWEIHSGIVHHKTGGVSARAEDPRAFWTDIALQGAIAAFFAWQSYRLRRFARRA